MRNNGIGSWTARRARMSPDRVAVVHGDDRVHLPGAARTGHPDGTRAGRASACPAATGSPTSAPTSRRSWRPCSAPASPAGSSCRSTPASRRPSWRTSSRTAARRCSCTRRRHAEHAEALRDSVPHVLDRATYERLLAGRAGRPDRRAGRPGRRRHDHVHVRHHRAGRRARRCPTPTSTGTASTC